MPDLTSRLTTKIACLQNQRLGNSGAGFFNLLTAFPAKMAVPLTVGL
jgi:hypothetical protein